MKRRSRTPEAKLKKILWDLCREITRKVHGNMCYTCQKGPLKGSNYQTGHFIPSSVGGGSLRYNLDNLRVQCYYCNINLGGNGSAFYNQLLNDKGQSYIDRLFQLKELHTDLDKKWLEAKIGEYEEILKLIL